MRKFLYVFFLIVLCQASYGQARVGFKAGVNLLTLNSDNAKPLDYDNPRPGVVLGFSCMLPVNKSLSIQPEVNYSYQSAQESYYNTIIGLTYTQVPLLFQYKPGKSGVVVYAGPQVNFLTKVKVDGDNSYSMKLSNFVQSDFGVCWGVGTRPNPNSVARNVTFDLRVFNGMTNVYKSVYDNGNKSRTMLYSLSIGYLFNNK